MNGHCNKKLCFIVLMTVLVCSLAACGQSNASGKEKAVTGLLKIIYDNPDAEQVVETLNKEAEEAEKDQKSGKTATYDGEETRQVLMNSVSQYLTDKAFDGLFTSVKLYDLALRKVNNGILVTIKDITCSMRDDVNMDIEVIVTVSGGDGEEKEFTFTGGVQFEEGSDKIAFIRLDDQEVQRYVGGLY